MSKNFTFSFGSIDSKTDFRSGVDVYVFGQKVDLVCGDKTIHANRFYVVHAIFNRVKYLGDPIECQLVFFSPEERSNRVALTHYYDKENVLIYVNGCCKQI